MPGDGVQQLIRALGGLALREVALKCFDSSFPLLKAWRLEKLVPLVLSLNTETYPYAPPKKLCPKDAVTRDGEPAAPDKSTSIGTLGQARTIGVDSEHVAFACGSCPTFPTCRPVQHVA